MSVLDVQNLSAGYGGRLAIEELTFSVESGQTVAVLGPNGGGKTTLFLALLDELPVRRGTVRVAGRIAHLPQHDHSRLDFPVSTLDVALMGAHDSTPWWRPADRAPALAALERVGLADVADEPYGELSGGQRRRAAIARALVADATVLLLDEPFAGVDAVSATRIEEAFASLASEGRSLLISTHDIHAARRADRVLCVNGTQCAYGPPAEVLDTPVLQETYGDELVVLEGGELAVAVDHHEHA